MQRFKSLAGVCSALTLLAALPAPAWAHEPPIPQVAAPSAEPAMDPVVRALLIAMAARMLTEAARSADPLGSLGDSMERALSSALRSPASARMFESLMGQALKDVPAELREPLALFAGSMLESLRRDLLDNRRSRSAR